MQQWSSCRGLIALLVRTTSSILCAPNAARQWLSLTSRSYASVDTGGYLSASYAARLRRNGPAEITQDARWQMKSFSYSELMSGKITRTRVEAWANTGKLSAETLVRIGHVGRFYQCIRKACPDPNFKISDVLTGEELQKFWNETADEGATIGRCPLVHQNAPTRPH
jgi:hypothetical protein